MAEDLAYYQRELDKLLVRADAGEVIPHELWDDLRSRAFVDLSRPELEVFVAPWIAWGRARAMSAMNPPEPDPVAFPRVGDQGLPRLDLDEYASKLRELETAFIKHRDELTWLIKTFRAIVDHMHGQEPGWK